MRNSIIIKHELLNLLSIIQINLIEGTLDANTRQQLIHLLNIASILISHEEIAFGEKPALFLQSIQLEDIIDDLQQRQPNDFLPLETSSESPQICISIDRYFFTEALQILIGHLTSRGESVHWNWNPQLKHLSIQHNAKLSEEILDLKKKRSSLSEIGLPISLLLIEAHDIEIHQKAQEIILDFKSVSSLPSNSPVRGLKGSTASEKTPQASS